MTAEPGPDRRPDDEVAREAARLRWELSRLRSRRSVRAAMLATEGAAARRGGAADVLATLRGRHVVEDLDVIAPAAVRRRPAYPHLEIAHLAPAPPFGAAAPHRRIGPDDPDALRRQPPDLVVLDALEALAGWSERARRSLREGLAAAGAVVAVAADERQAQEAADWPADLVLVGPGVTPPPGARTLPWLPGVDPLVDNPVGWRRTPARGPVGLGDAPPGTAGLPAVDSVDEAASAAAVVVAGAGTAGRAGTVLALLARGVPVLAPDDAPLPAPLAALVERHPAADLAAAAEHLGEDLDARERRSVRRRREVLDRHGHRARLEAVLEALAVPRRPPQRISVLLATRRPGGLEAAVAGIAAQDHPDVEVVAALHGEGFGDDAERRVAEIAGRACPVVRVEASRPLGDVLNAALDRATGSLIAKMDDDDLYGPGHLSDLVVALEYSGAEIVGRWANEVHLVDADVTVVRDLDRQERWAHHLPGATMLAHGDVVREVRFRRVPRHVDTHLLRSIHAAGGAAYATHRFGFVRRRHGDHTYERGDGAFGDATSARPGLDRSVLDV